MSSTDFFGLAMIIFAARSSSEKVAFAWMLIFGSLHIASMVFHIAKGATP